MDRMFEVARRWNRLEYLFDPTELCWTIRCCKGRDSKFVDIPWDSELDEMLCWLAEDRYKKLESFDNFSISAARKAYLEEQEDDNSG